MIARLAMVVAVLAAVADPTQAAVLCRGKGDRLVVRDACRKRERAVDPASVTVAGPSGAPGVAGGDGADAASPLRIVDANGTELGRILQFYPSGAWVEVGPPTVPAAMILLVGATGFSPDNNYLRYTSTDCSGVPYMRENHVSPANVHPEPANVYGIAAYYKTGARRDVTHNSTESGAPPCSSGGVATARGTCCFTQTATDGVVPAARVLLNDLFTPPFRAVPR